MSVKRMITLAVTCLILLGAAAGLHAQSYRTFQDEYTDVRDRNLMRFGPLRILPTFRLTEVGYDTNVYYRDQEASPVADYTATLSPEIKGFWLVGSSMILSITENPEYVFFLNETPLRAFTNSFSPAARILLFRRIAVSGDYHVQKHTRRAYSEFEGPVTDTRTGWAGHVFFETPRGTAIGVSGSEDEYRYTGLGPSEVPTDFALALDRKERAAVFEFYYRVFSQSYLFAGAGYSDFTFLNPDSSWRDAWSTRAYGGIRFPLAGRARGTVCLGYKRFVPRSPDRRSFAGLTADTDVFLRLGRVALSGAYARDNYFSSYEDRFRGGLSLYLFPFLRLEGSFQSGAWRYPEPQEVWYQGGYVLLDSRKDATRNLAAGIAFRISGHTGLGLSYNFYRRRSNAPGFDINRRFFGAYVAHDF
jgi:hypothetical protein